jgi:hypothetical protein
LDGPSQIFGCGLKTIGIVAELPDSLIAAGAEKSADFAGLVTVVDVNAVDSSLSAGADILNVASANGALAFLLHQEVVKGSRIQAILGFSLRRSMVR